MRLKLFLILFVTCTFLNESARAQVTISGSKCAVAGGTVGYLYTITGDVQAGDNLFWKVSGGLVLGTSGSSTKGSFESTGGQLRVIWNSGVSSGKVKVTCDRLGEFEMEVQVITFPNTISKPTSAPKSGNALTIVGSLPNISGCQLGSSFWWESADSAEGPFVEINLAIDKDLSVTVTKTKTLYRRALFVNGDVIYSNIITVVGQ